MNEPISVDYQLPAWTATHLARLNTVVCADLFELCATIPPGCVDLIISDLPYGTTACSWDEIIPFAPMWAAFKRVIKPRGAIVLTGSQPFTSKLIMSNLAMFRYEWIWDKASPVGFLNVNNRPMSQHESVLVFAFAAPDYYPQLRKDVGKPFGKIQASRLTDSYGDFGNTINYSVGYPFSIIKFPRPSNLSDGGYHPTQKPIPLFEYLIRTYTQLGDLVFDPCVGSGTTALAARSTGRRFICGDKEQQYVDIANARLAQPYTPNLFDSTISAGERPAPTQESMFEAVSHD